MSTELLRRFGALFFGVLIAVFASKTGMSEEVLSPMAGTPTAAKRVLDPAGGAQPSKPAPEVEVASPKAADVVPAADSSDKLGPIHAVTVYGSVSFAEREDVAGRILAALGGGDDKTVAAANAAIASVRQDLIKQGYYLVRINLLRDTPYNAEKKALLVVVDEGRFGKVNLTFEGADEDGDGTWFSRSQIMRRFRDIEEGATFEYARLRRALFDANSHPDLVIDTAIDVRKPVEGEDRSRRVARYADLNMTVRESIPLHMVFEINNYGMEEIEEWQASITVQYLNLTKHDDVLTFSPAMSWDGSLYSYAASYMLPHDWWLGGNTTLYGGYSTLDVDDIVPQLDLEGTGYFVGLQHSESIYDTDRHLLAVSAGILWRYIEDEYTALSYKLKKRSATILPLSLALSYTGRKPDSFGGRNFGTLQAVYNLWNAHDKLRDMWMESEEHYWLFRWQLARLQPIFGWYDSKSELNLHQWMLFFKLEGQYTRDTLIPVEKLAMGGYNSLRGYHTRGYLGDYGVYGTVELRTPILVDTMASLFGDRTDKAPIDRLQFLTFVDWGWAAYNDLPAGSNDRETLCSAGFGVRMAVTQYTQMKCDMAFPLRDTDWGEDDDFEVYLSVQVQF